MLGETGLWRDVTELPASLAETLERRDGVPEVAALLRATSTRRVVTSGNGAAYYVAMALWLASLERTTGPEVVAAPSGLLARGGFAWRPGDVLLAVSSSGEFRDLVEAVDAGAPQPYAAVTANASSTLGSRAGARALVTLRSERAVTHTQAFCGAVVAALDVWAETTGDEELAVAVRRAPELAAAAIEAAERWAGEQEAAAAPAAVAFGSGPGWAAALEAALLLKEVAGIPAEGLETREGATSAMMALRPGDLALSLATSTDDGLLREAEEICRARGATVVRAPVVPCDRRLAAVTTFPAAAALATRIGLARGLDVDRPAWVDDYYRVARQTV
jgi:glucosamine--fructose-6-phosphate aminotransferase (isomerizing)